MLVLNFRYVELVADGP